jgi:hypothetical protein
MSPSPAPSTSSESSSDDEEIEKIEAVTKFSKSMPDERLDCPEFQREDEDDPRVMVERPPGSNEWYQYYYETESYNEIKLRSPATRKTSEHIEWIDKKSSRLSRISLSTKLWKYIKGTDGAWMPHGTEQKRKYEEKETKKPSGSKKRDHASGNGNTDSDLGHAVDTSTGVDGKKNKKSRLGYNKPGPKPGKSKKGDSKKTKKNKNGNGGVSSSSGMDTDEEKDYLKNKAAMGALASWFTKHNDALKLKLPGTAEAAGLDHITKKQQQQQQNNKLGSGGGNGGADRKNTVAAVGGGKREPGSSKPASPLQPAPSKSLDRKPVVPKIVKNAAPLEDDDLFGRGGGGGGGGKPTLTKKPSGLTTIGSSGSGHLSPMNSLPSINLKKDSFKSSGMPSRLGSGGLGGVGGVPQPQGGVHVKPGTAVVSPKKRDFLKPDASVPIRTNNGLAVGAGSGPISNLNRTESGGESGHGGGGSHKN